MDRLYGALWTALTQVSMAGEANDDPVPLMGAGVDDVAVSNVTVGSEGSLMPSVVSVAFKVTLSVTESLSENDTCPLASLVAEDGGPMTPDVPELDWRLTAFPGMALPVAVSSVTTAVAYRPSQAEQVSAQSRWTARPKP